MSEKKVLQPTNLIQQTWDLPLDEIRPDLPEVMSRQATMNIGTIGHVAHGKSTVVRALTGVSTGRFKAELTRNSTVLLGYANAKIFKCTNASCARPGCYMSGRSNSPDVPSCQKCGADMALQRHVSLVDCPGHELLMATMVTGVAVMDAALLLIAGDEPCPQPQTAEHLGAIGTMNLQNILVVQNKLDLVSYSDAESQHQDIRSFLSTFAIKDDVPIVPVCAQQGYNIDVLAEMICGLPMPHRDYLSPARLTVVRSFDVNKPGTLPHQLAGGVAGGSLTRGVLRIGDKIEIRPGIVKRAEAAEGETEGEGEWTYAPLTTPVVSLRTEENELAYAVPGGLIGVGTLVDPCLTRHDMLVGQVLGAINSLPPVYHRIKIKHELLNRLLGVRSADAGVQVQPLRAREQLFLNIGSMGVGGVATPIEGTNEAIIELKRPVCCAEGETVAMSRRVNRTWRLIGWANVVSGEECTKVSHL